MHVFVLSTLLLASLAASQTTLDASGAAVEIQKQRLIKFPEEFDPNVAPPTVEKADEAKRILEQIARVNEAFGYVKKQPEQKKLPPILDSSQYLFPKPAYQPFHAQQHHFAGSHGQTLLEPSIRAVKLTRNVAGSSYNLPPRLRKGTPAPASEEKKSQLYFRPNQVELPKPLTEQEAQQLPAHFAIPVHLYKLNKEQYLREHAAQEYRVKGYKIIGDVDSFYGKAKSGRKQGKTTPKYHLFFLPRELALNEDGTPKRGNSTSITSTKAPAAPQGFKDFRLDSREKPSHKPHKMQTTVSPDSNNLNSGSRKRTSSTVKPVRGSGSMNGKEAEQLLPTISTTSAPVHLSTLPPSGGLLPNRNRLNPFRMPGMNLSDMQNQTSSAIKNAFQNIFKMPFRQVGALSGAQPVIMGSIPQKHQVSSDSQDYKWDDEKEGGGDGDGDLNGNTEDLENTAAEQDSSASSEKHLFAHKTRPGGLMHTIGHVATAQQTTQKQALREGGIIIQRLKVRKGGIAIAGPGGVATAGSGGTAIVGPGGYALTHPRSLTIAGPGAKVISIPANVDLQDALARTDLQARSFPREGKVVATGPTVYYAPPTGTTEEEAWPPRSQPLGNTNSNPGIALLGQQSAKLIEKDNQLTPYGAFQPAFIYNAPYYAAYNLPLAYVLQPTTPAAPVTADATTTTTTTIRPESSAEEIEKPEKLQALPQPQAETQSNGDLKSDSGLRSAVSKINPNYVIEEILAIPGKHVISTATSARQQLRKNASGPAKLRKASASGKRVPVKVEATGKTSTSSGNIPQIQFGNYFLPYQPLQAQAIQGRKQAALILEPHSRAVVGNGGTAISTPISKAYLKKGVPTNVYFNPDSVAIAGVGGKAHATADLELDLFN
ncbi:GL20695 [Drosophila persimilis]|uniref:GL20695 n=1 Tax=Drosophila persimilis TaxID=7234 RepID=B4H4E2_DROPE|nr:GL20695 [Drosophila persimilis]